MESRAKKLLDGIEARDAVCLGRIRAKIPSCAEADYQDLNHDHSRTTVAREAGFKTWQMAIDMMELRLVPGDDFGDFWYSTTTDVMLNHWCRNYEEALEVHKEHGGFLVPYRRHFAVVQRGYIKILGMDADDPAWQVIGNNLVEPGDKSTYRCLVLARLKQIRPNPSGEEQS